MPNDVIDRVHILARCTAANVALVFAGRHVKLIPDYDDDDPNDEDYTPPDNDDATDNDDHNDNVHDLVDNEGDNQPALLEPPPINQQDDDANINEDEATNQDEDDGAEPNEELEVNFEDEMDEQYGVRTGAYNLRARKPRDYSHLHATLEDTV
jgi:hypothetical protein